MTERLRAAGERSRVVQVVARTGRAVDDSFVARASRRTGRVTRQSYLYRWLTAEPDPDVVVIDLRETWTVGPAIAALDWLTERLAPAVASSHFRTATGEAHTALQRAPLRVGGLAVAIAFTASLLASALTGRLTAAGFVWDGLVVSLALAASRVDLTWRELGETKIGKTVVAAFEPPAYDERD
ncbi:hypothetical protein [Haladaptatus sp. DYSN1]|uniref:hypothetical protein n=1 Tax=unclassified Haladaptatus TaxID=2622732 RepID=UPI0024064848|nr:hypothetical protein [Haladaptatus sp. DYSN1]